MDETIYFTKNITGWRPNKDLTLFIQYKKIFIKIGKLGATYSGLMHVNSLSDKSMLQFKGMAVYDKDLYRLKQDEYNNWILVNVSKLSKVRDSAYNDPQKLSQIKEEDFTTKLLSPIEALVVNHILKKLVA